VKESGDKMKQRSKGKTQLEMGILKNWQKKADLWKN
jgi:hypothetical protein